VKGKLDCSERKHYKFPENVGFECDNASVGVAVSGATQKVLPVYYVCSMNNGMDFRSMQV
jgi:hypothetical protein